MNLTNRLSQRRTSVGLLVAALSLAGLAAGPRAQASGTSEGLELRDRRRTRRSR